MTPSCTHILLVDDELLLTFSVQRLLRGMTVLASFGLSDAIITAGTGRQALQYVAEAAPARIGLVILDASLPDVYGVDLLRMLRAGAYPALGAGCRFVVWSSWECQTAARAQGAHGSISKVRSERYAFTDDLVTMLTALITTERTWYALGPFGSFAGVTGRVGRPADS